ncbi:MAG: sulfite exporter TauE/SafE family protein [Bacteroidales bacterium]|nr:sulfite exporter TauE/SafE family protein [Bacteroidales bacterium]
MNENMLTILLHGDHHHHLEHYAPFIIGLIASILHVISGPDHLAAVTPLAIDNKLKSWFIGLGWGIGHTGGMLLIGILFILFKNFIPIEAISAYGEIVVGFVLIGIGTWAIWKVFGKPHLRIHAHPHTHFEADGSYTHVHDHEHPARNIHQHEHSKVVRQSFFTAITIGVIHGFAGVSHLMGILPTLAFESNFDSAMYLTGFGAGTIAAMVAFSFLLGFVAWQTDERFKPVIFKTIQLSGAGISIIVGIFWIIQVM